MQDLYLVTRRNEGLSALNVWFDVAGSSARNLQSCPLNAERCVSRNQAEAAYNARFDEVFE